MKLRTAIRTVRILGAVAIVFILLWWLLKINVLLYVFCAVLIALLAVLWAFVKCPSCGMHFLRLSDSALRSGKCPNCGEDLELY